jgi:hypothetical protein
MSESELIQAYYGAINLAYTTTTWWVTISTALVVATYFAAKHIPSWLMLIALALYIVTAISVLYELHGYSDLALDYGQRLAQLHGGNTSFGRDASGVGGSLNSFAIYAVVMLGSLSATAFSFVTWRAARTTGK